MITIQFIPRHLEKALDMARHIATFGHLEFTACHVQLRITDPAKVVHMDLLLTPDVNKTDKDINFGVNLQMFYKLIRSLDCDVPVTLEVDESVMILQQGPHLHTLIHQDIKFAIPELVDFTGPKLQIYTKLLQRYIRAIGNIAPAFELNYKPLADTLYVESVNSMYRTLFSIDTANTPNDAEEYRRSFMVKFVEMVLSPGLAETVQLTLGEALVVAYERPQLSVVVTVASYAEA